MTLQNFWGWGIVLAFALFGLVWVSFLFLIREFTNKLQIYRSGGKKLSNKFQKSVLERLELEESRVKKEKKQNPKSKQENIKEPIIIQTETKEIEENTDKEKEEIESDIKLEVNDIDTTVKVEPERKAKNKTFYLDEDLINIIKNHAKRQKTTDSKLINDILRQVFKI